MENTVGVMVPGRVTGRTHTMVEMGVGSLLYPPITSLVTEMRSGEGARSRNGSNVAVKPRGHISRAINNCPVNRNVLSRYLQRQEQFSRRN
jgi:hypothetical protein